MTVKTATAMTTCPVGNDAAPIETPAAIHIIRFLGLTAASANPRPNPLDRHVVNGLHPFGSLMFTAASAPLLCAERKQENTQGDLDPRNTSRRIGGLLQLIRQENEYYCCNDDSE